MIMLMWQSPLVAVVASSRKEVKVDGWVNKAPALTPETIVSFLFPSDSQYFLVTLFSNQVGFLPEPNQPLTIV